MAKRSSSSGQQGPQVFAIVQQVPPRVTAAFSAIHHLHGFRVLSSRLDGAPTELRDFSQKETALWNASLDALRLYISGESNAQDVRPLNEESGQNSFMVMQTPDGQQFTVPFMGGPPPTPPNG